MPTEEIALTLTESWETFAGVGQKFGHFMKGAFENYKIALERGVLTQEQKWQKLAENVSDGYRNAASWATAYAEGARGAGKHGIAQIMQKHADIYAARANTLIDPVIDAKTRLDERRRGRRRDARRTRQRQLLRGQRG
jgi:hypothetical protein